MSATRLTDFLVDGDHPVTMDRYASIDDVREALSDGVLLIRCTDTRGTTELSCELPGGPTTLELKAPGGRFDFVGELTLDDIDLRVSASIGTEDLAGTARFERL